MAELQSLSTRDFAIVETLSLRVRLLSVPQLARTWWRDSRHAIAHARRAARRLEQAGLVRRTMLFAHPEIELHEPVVTWNVGEAAPDFRRATRILTSRWNCPAELTPAFLATPAAANFFGGFARSDPRRSEQTHDLHLSGVFLAFAARYPELIPHWRSEAWIHRSRPDGPGVKLPDALVSTQGLTRVIEFGGAYSRAKLEAFHRFCAASAHSYEVW